MTIEDKSQRHQDTKQEFRKELAVPVNNTADGTSC